MIGNAGFDCVLNLSAMEGEGWVRTIYVVIYIYNYITTYRDLLAGVRQERKVGIKNHAKIKKNTLGQRGVGLKRDFISPLKSMI